MRESRWWLLSMAAALAMVVLLFIHMGLMHLSGLLEAAGVEMGNVRAFAAVMERGKSVAQMIFYLIFLAAALSHGLYGTRSVLLEIVPSRSQVVVSSVLMALGLVAFLYGAYVTVKTFAG